MLDLKRIRTDFDTVAAKLKTRGVSEDTLTTLKALDEQRRTLLVQTEELKAQRNIASAAIAQAKRQKEDASQQIADMQQLAANIKAIDAKLADIDQEITSIITVLPNTPMTQFLLELMKRIMLRSVAGEGHVSLTLISRRIGILEKP